MRFARGTTTARRARVGTAAAGAALVAAGIGLVGCAPEPIPPVPTTERPTPTVEPTSEPEPEPEPAPETVHPERPAAMDTVDAAGAQAAVEYFLNLYPYAYATGDLDEWRELSHPECIFCASVIDNVEETFGEGFRTLGGLTTVSEVASRSVEPGDAWMVTGSLLQAPSRTVDAQDEVTNESEAGTYAISAFVFHDDSRWWIRGVDYERSE